MFSAILYWAISDQGIESGTNLQILIMIQNQHITTEGTLSLWSIKVYTSLNQSKSFLSDIMSEDMTLEKLLPTS